LVAGFDKIYGFDPDSLRGQHLCCPWCMTLVTSVGAFKPCNFGRWTTGHVLKGIEPDSHAGWY
jgi:hypothetical protein